MSDNARRDRPVLEVREITPEMVNAATRVLWESGRLYAIADGADQLVVREMLFAALSSAHLLTTKQGRRF